MVKKVLLFSLLIIFAFSLNGCATGGRQKDLEIQGLRNQISVLEAQVQAKDEEINNLKDSAISLPKIEGEEEVMPRPKKAKVKHEVKSRPNVKQIQIALRNAGFEPGAIDGKMGRQTREAIKEFQRANNLSADGKVGKRTWGLLREYLYKKLK